VDGAGFEMDKRFFFSPQHQHWLIGPPSFQLSGYHCSFLGFKGLQHEMITHIHCSAKCEWNCTSYHLSLCGMERDNITFSFVLLSATLHV
jgi:hypothetical protein